MAIPPVPPVADAERYVLYTPGGVAKTFVDVPFPVYGDGSDLVVKLDANELDRSLWSLVSWSGNPIDSLPRPLTDGRIFFSPDAVATTIEVIGEIRPRQETMATAAGIARREFNQTLGYILSALRELWRKVKNGQAQAFGFDASGPLASRTQFDLEAEGFRFAQTDDASGRPILYIKLSSADADWSQAISFQGPQGVAGAAGATPTAATAAEVRAGTEAAKYVSPKALMDAADERTLTDAATIDWDMSLGFNAVVTLGGNRTLGEPTNAKKGMTYALRVVQDGAGSRTLAYHSAWDWGAAGAPTLTTTTNKHDIVMAYCRVGGVSPKFDCSILKGFG